MRSWKKRNPDEPPKTSAYDRALGLLSRREHSAKELATKLKDRGYAKEDADRALATARERSYQSDARYAGVVIRRRTAAGYGPRYIEAELKSHGIDPRLHRDAIDEVDWVAQAREQVAKRGFDLSDREARAKANQYLARRGFDGPAIKAATGAVIAEE